MVECAEAQVGVLVRGAGTSLAGQACNNAVIIDISRYLDRLLHVDREAALATVEPGISCQELNGRLEGMGLCFAPDPSTKDVATLGGMFANNSCGVRSVRYGPTADNVDAIRGITSDGDPFSYKTPASAGTGPFGHDQRVIRSMELSDSLADEIKAKFPRIPRRISGYNLDAFSSPFPDPVRGLCGSEGTLAVITELDVRLVPLPGHTALAVLAFSDIVDAASAVPDLLEARPIGLEAIDGELAERCRHAGMHLEAIDSLPSGGAWLLVEVEGETEEAAREEATRILHSHRNRSLSSTGAAGAVFMNESARSVWSIRKSALAMATLNPHGPKESVGWEDAAVRPDRLAAYLRDFIDLVNDYGLGGTIFGHFGDGCVHTHLSFDFASEEGRRKFAGFLESASELVVEHGGSLSGEHGDGQARALLLEKMFGARIIEGFRSLKRIWDPAGILNPRRVVDAPSPTANLRAAHRKKVALRRRGLDFGGAADGFVSEFDRCVGAGACVRKASGVGGATMCPTYMATVDERHSTRGRARLLFEMSLGELIEDGWRNDEVAEALEMCIGCKACKAECPAAVDMSALKAEFFYQRNGAFGLGRESATELFFGLSPFWLRTHRAPLLRHVFRIAANSALLRRIAGLAESSEIPEPSRTKPGSAPDAGIDRPSGSTAVVWPDCFSIHFDPAVYESALRVLTEAGITPVQIRRRVPSFFPLCCGRPLIESGMLGLAGKVLKKAADLLESPPYRNLPIVFLEPSCLSVFRCEIERLLSGSRAASLSARTVSFTEVVAASENRYQPNMPRRVALFTHCHQRALWGTSKDVVMLNAFGLEAEQVSGGCCGMAGKFGLSRKTAHISRAVYDRQVKDAVERIPDDTVILADGFSCRLRLKALQRRPVMHTAELLADIVVEEGRS